jgi:large-conductance mechanosensitive channel
VAYPKPWGLSPTQLLVGMAYERLAAAFVSPVIVVVVAALLGELGVSILQLAHRKAGNSMGESR